jgi:transcriptional regulator with XRE-family HTH domain
VTLAQFRRRLGANVRRARLDADMTQEEVAHTGIIQKRHYQEIEAGRKNPKAETLFALAVLFQTSVAALVDVQPKPARAADVARRSYRAVERRPPRKRNWDALGAAEQRVAAILDERKRRKKAKAPKRRK